MLQESWLNIGPLSHDTATCEMSEHTTLNPLISSAADSLASRIVSLADVGRTPMTETSGPSSPASFARFSPGGCWLRMFQGYSRQTLDGSLDEFLETWPRSGTMQNGQLYQRVAWVPHTHENACSFWPTPGAGGTGSNARGSSARRTAVRNGTYLSGKVNPCLTEWLMGFPEGWTALED
jgi:hypothetical protein